MEDGRGALGPVSFNIHPVFYNVNSDCLIRLPGASGTQEQEMKYVPFFSSLISHFIIRDIKCLKSSLFFFFTPPPPSCCVAEKKEEGHICLQ